MGVCFGLLYMFIIFVVRFVIIYFSLILYDVFGTNFQLIFWRKG